MTRRALKLEYSVGMRKSGAKLGTFGGVFTPSLLTILGIILFRRLGFVVGSSGLLQALFMLSLASAISILTSISLSALATNRKIKGGGDYYIISRTLGVEFGGALGLIIFLAQAISVGFYVVGFGEATASILSAPPLVGKLTAIVVSFALFFLAYRGADLATRFQFVIMGILVSAIISFFFGASSLWSQNLLNASWSSNSSQEVNFWIIFAIFFPAVTGFTQGVSMSGDLKDPARSLPLGTFLAVGLSTIVYIAAMVAMAGSLPLDTLTNDYDSMRSIAVTPWLIDAGVLSATLSSALSSFLGAPRILQALAKDGLFTSLNVFSAGHGSSNNPRRAVILTAVIALTTITLGDLNTIATLVSMCFLVSYGLLNYATYVEAVGASPSFRPRFRFFHAKASLAGTGLCGFVMLMLDPWAGLSAIGILTLLYQYLHWTAVPAKWRDSRGAYRFKRVKDGLREISEQPQNPLDWQPHILVFTETPARRERLLRVSDWIAGGSGITTAVQLIEGDGTLPSVQATCRTARNQLATDIDKHGLEAYPLAVAASDLRVGATTLLQSWGVGPVNANTVVLNWRDSKDQENENPNLSRWYALLLQRAARLEQHVIVLDAEEKEWTELQETALHKRRIDVWWFENDSSRLALLFAYLMTRCDEWDEASIQVLAPSQPGLESKVKNNLHHRLEERRIDATVQVVNSSDGNDMYDISSDASFVLLPTNLDGMQVVHSTGGSVDTLFQKLPVVAMVTACGDFNLQEDHSTPNSKN